MKQCERCLKHTDGIHTCTPTDFVRKLEEASKWQPIETAPKDGTWVWLCGGKTTEDDYYREGVFMERPVSAFWKIDKHGDEHYWAFCFWDGEWREGYENPTHWKPLIGYF